MGRLGFLGRWRVCVLRQRRGTGNRCGVPGAEVGTRGRGVSRIASCPMRPGRGVAWRAIAARALCELGWDGDVEEAATYWQRARGLIACSALDEATRPRILVFPRCRSVHTWFMSAPIDIAFVDAAGRVIQRHSCVPPWSMRSCARAYLVIERCSPREVASRVQGEDAWCALSG